MASLAHNELSTKPLSGPMLTYCNLRRLRPKFSEIWIKQNTTIFLQEIDFENVICKMAAILSQPKCVNA